MPLSRELTEAERRALKKRDVPEILCDYPGCQKIAIELIGGAVRDLNFKFAVCAEHLNSRDIIETDNGNPLRT